MKYVFLGYVVMLLLSCNYKEAYKFEIAEKDGITLASPISLKIDTLGLGDADDQSNLVLKNNGKQIPFQIDNGQKRLWFVHTPNNNGSYEIVKEEAQIHGSEGVKTDKNNGNLQLLKGSIPLLTYRYGMTYPPKGVDSIFRKSGYLHPLLSPSGDTLSRIQPPDHYHHYGIWGPWTHTQIEGERVDFWNLVERQGTVLFKDFNDTYSGALYGGFNARQEHINLKASEDNRIALNEDLDVKVWDLDRPDRYMVDYTSNFSSPLKNGILFEAYRYGGGLGMRFTERWHKDNCTVLTSEGNDRLTADGTNARWCMVTGESADGKGTNGVLFLSYPENRSHPEPMRIWPIDGNGGRGDMFFEFCPIRHEEWKIEPNKDYSLKYRMVVFDGELTAEEAESYWKSFAEMPRIVNN
ncbi:PmoA family protein [Arenibacter sp. BSSL-BM3]|uniref:PmoA family protein n=1 Tax=Arenibacter arenosicollis TaxID=2762274 RepID=A0ABR7QMK4_9FLAO|nr:PmoA family protein [Arenibacter arenosicollis]MBC8768329.1 PmoA family protein [Arenibacter arenosicollis]